MIELKMSFENVSDLRDFFAIKAAEEESCTVCQKPEKIDIDMPISFTPVKQKPELDPEQKPDEPEPELDPEKMDTDTPVSFAPDEPEPEPEQKQHRKVTGQILAASLREYKEKNGHPAYKALLKKYDAGKLRDIKKEDFAPVVEEIENSFSRPELTDLDAEPAAESIETPVQRDVSLDEMRAELTAHKNSHGMPATMAILHDLGYATAADVPEAMFADLVDRLHADTNTDTDGSDNILDAF